MDKVAGGGIAITGTYCVLRVDGVLEWVCYAILAVLIIWIGNKLLNIFSPRTESLLDSKTNEKAPKKDKKPKKQTKTPQDTSDGFN